MSVIQISKIQLRRGLEQDFTSSTALSPAEMAFATNTGRLFIGADDNMLGPWSNRTAQAPYGNIEVLTEASLQTFARLFDRFNRSLGPIDGVDGQPSFQRRPYFEADLPDTDSTSQPVMVKAISETTGSLDDLSTDEFVIANVTRSCGARLEYYIMAQYPEGGSGRLECIRSGLLTIVHNGDVAFPAQVVDEYVTFPLIPADGDPVLFSDAYDTGLLFGATIQGNGDGNYRVRLEYTNNTGVTLTLLVRGSSAADITP